MFLETKNNNNNNNNNNNLNNNLIRNKIKKDKMVSQGKNKLIQKYSSDFSYYFNNQELSDIIIQVSENGYLDEDVLTMKPIPINIKNDKKPTFEEIIELINQRNNCLNNNSNNKIKNDETNRIDYFYTHKFVLSARSPVFMKMLSCQMMESNSVIITSHFPRSIFYILLKFLYSGKVEMNATNVLEVLAIADYYQLEDLKDFCGKYSLQTCIDGELDICRVLYASEQYGLEKIKQLCLDYISQHSMDILLSSPNWHLLSEENLIEILEQDNLRVPEVEIFDSLVRWAEKQYSVLLDLDPSIGDSINKPDFLKKKLSKPLKSIRFASMFPYQLSSHIEKTNLVDKEILYEAYRYCAAQIPTSINSSSCELRQGVKEFTFQFNGDTNGVLYYFGTCEDMEDYESPVTRKVVTVTSSTMSIGYPHPFVGRQSTNMYTDKEENSFFCVDLGVKHVLCPTYYSLRYGGDSQGSIYAAPKNWQLLGSLDGQEWTLLRDHSNDLSLKDGYGIAGWEVKSIHSYRYLKILQTGPNQRDGNELCLCCFEVYGRLVSLEDDNNNTTCSSLTDAESDDDEMKNTTSHIDDDDSDNEDVNDNNNGDDDSDDETNNQNYDDNMDDN
ncbi:hypothetical protein ACTFIR_012497 [Dictyostelium discoideum]